MGKALQVVADLLLERLGELVEAQPIGWHRGLGRRQALLGPVRDRVGGSVPRPSGRADDLGVVEPQGFVLEIRPELPLDHLVADLVGTPAAPLAEPEEP
jgi:hypothetical protein